MDSRLQRVLRKNEIEPDSMEKMPQEAGRMKNVFHIRADRSTESTFIYRKVAAREEETFGKD
ncbi:MAG: hypothetical protein ABEK16_04515 [Candidatus Nanohalobium sp.]